MPNCKNCGLELKPNWILCPQCKTRVFNERHKPDNTLSIIHDKEPDKRAGGILLIFGIPLALFSIVMVISNYYWMSYHLDQYGNPGLYNVLVAIFTGLLVISVILIIFGIFLKLKNIKRFQKNRKGLNIIRR